MSVARLLPLLVLLTVGCGSSNSERGDRGTVPLSPATSSRESITIPVGGGHLAAMAPANGLTLRDKPNGAVIAHLRPKTDWGSPTVVWATGRRGHWLSVVATALPNNRLGWLDVRHDRPRMWRSRLALYAD